jgi:predicted DNA-binding transcriptional regulator AlpA
MQQTLTGERLMTRAEVQTHFGLTQRFLEVSAVRGDGPPMVKIGRSVRYRVADLRDWIAARRVNSTSEEVRQ